jgi:hypothetical protein
MLTEDKNKMLYLDNKVSLFLRERFKESYKADIIKDISEIKKIEEVKMILKV